MIKFIRIDASSKRMAMDTEVPEEKHNSGVPGSPEKGMDTFRCIATRRSIRKYQDIDVPMELVSSVIDAARYAPSAGNSQNWRFVLVKDPAKIDQLAEASYNQLWMNSAPIIIVVCSDPEKLGKFYGTRGERLYSIQNCAAAVENMLLASHALGLASCWVGAFDEDKVKRDLGIPDSVRVQAILPLGYPDEVVPTPMHFTLENVCYFEKYGNRVRNIDRVFQNPNVVGRIQREVGNLTKMGKRVVDKVRKNLSQQKPES